MITPALPDDDIGHVIHQVGEAWSGLRGQRLFVSGGTGFFGRWLLESLLAADREYSLGVHVTVLSRNPERFLSSAPHLGLWSRLSWERGSVDALTPASMPGQRFDLFVHLATEADLQATAASPAAANKVIAGGTRQALELAARTGARRFLFTSSGSVYSAQPPGAEFLHETHPLGSFNGHEADARAIGAEAKRQAEQHCAEAARRSGIGIVIARCFTFAGPGQLLSGKFAFGNFIGDALSGGPIVVKGDGTPIRSYLYGADLAVWLWTLLLKGAPGLAYNVGSERPVSIRELAYAVSSELAVPGVRILTSTPGGEVDRYVPSTSRARSQLGLGEHFTLQDMIRRTADWSRFSVKH